MKRQDEYEPLGDGITDFPDQDVAIVRDEQGHATITPRALQRLTPEARQAMRLVAQCAERIHVEQQLLDELILSARKDYKVSWNAVGWCIGTSGQNARQRWGDVGGDGED
jgi:hypothetical protein